MSDERPRPQYGEYATPEEQARAAGQTYVPPPPPPVRPVTPVNAAAEHQGDHDPTTPDVPIFNRARFIDRVVTNGLLIIGVFSFIQAFQGYLSFGTVLKATATSFKITDFEPAAGVDAVGRWLLVINIVLLVASIAVSVAVARRGHLTFYIPLVGFVLFSIVQGTMLYLSAPSLLTQISEHYLR